MNSNFLSKPKQTAEIFFVENKTDDNNKMGSDQKTINEQLFILSFYLHSLLETHNTQHKCWT